MHCRKMTSIMEPNKGKKEKLISFLFWIGIWALMALLIHQDILLVTPWSAFRRFIQLLGTGEFWKSVITSMLRILAGLLLGAAAASMAGILSAKYNAIRILLSPFVSTIKAIPVASFIILVLIYVPSSRLSTVISFLMVFPILYENLLEGILSCDTKLLEMAEVFHLNRRTVAWNICFSQVLPYLRSGLSLAIGLAWKSGIAAEVIGLPDHSIGEHLYESKVYLDTMDLFAWTLAIILLSVFFQKLTDHLLDHIQHRIETEE